MDDLQRLKTVFLCSAFNGLSQKVWAFFSPLFEQSILIVGISSDRIHQFKPDLIICPYLQDYIPAEIFENYPCLVIHPGPPGEAGPNSLNWAVLEGIKTWGVSIIQADRGWDTGSIWAYKCFPIPERSVAHIYRGLVSDFVLEILPQAIKRYFSGEKAFVRPYFRYRPKISRKNLEFRWQDNTKSIIKKINAGDNLPGTIGSINNHTYQLFGIKENSLKGEPGTILKIEKNGICVATGDRSLWIARMAPLDGIKMRPVYWLTQSAVRPKFELPRQENICSGTLFR